jgi:phosphoadenosine phosphosulfate reductase
MQVPDQADSLSNILAHNKAFEDDKPEKVIEWAIDRFYPKLAIASSFSVEDTVVIDMATKIQPDIKVFYINTGCEFRETDETKTIIKNRHHLNLTEYASKLTVEEQGRAYGEELFRKDPDLCCQLRKIEPIKRALSGLDSARC